MNRVTPKQRKLIDQATKFMDLMDVQALLKSRFNYVRDSYAAMQTALSEARAEALASMQPDKASRLIATIAAMQIDDECPHVADDSIDTLRSLITQAQEITDAR